MIKEELSDAPLYYGVDKLSKVLHIQSPPSLSLRYMLITNYIFINTFDILPSSGVHQNFEYRFPQLPTNFYKLPIRIDVLTYLWDLSSLYLMFMGLITTTFLWDFHNHIWGIKNWILKNVQGLNDISVNGFIFI